MLEAPDMTLLRTTVVATVLAAIIHGAPARATDNPSTVSQWRPESAADLVQLAECHAATAARLRKQAAKLGADPAWTFAHQTLSMEHERHALVGEVIWSLMDRLTYGSLLKAHFPDGFDADDSAARVDRWTRCVRLYGQIANIDRRRRRALAQADGAVER
jgi:hypothetical protein